MKRGWKNDPAWVAHYRQRDDERAERQLEVAKLEHQIKMLDAQREAAAARAAHHSRQPTYEMREFT